MQIIVQNVQNQVNAPHVKKNMAYLKENVLNHVQQHISMMKEYVLHVLIIVIYVQKTLNYIQDNQDKKK